MGLPKALMGTVHSRDKSVEQLVARHRLVSNQMNRAQLRTILTELDQTLSRGTAGATVEFGCYIGTTSLFIRRLLDARGQDRAFHVYDSFAGLPPKSVQDASITGEDFTAGALAVSKKQFLHEFTKANLKPPIVHKNWFAELTPSDIPDHVAFALLDGDFYESIRDSLRLVMPRMEPGGVIIIDDYAREALPGAATATHEFFPPNEIRTQHNLGIIHC